jgi:DNA-binding transcriptional LysR family regulator
MDDFFRAGGIVPDYVIETRSTLVARQLALEGAGIAIMDRISGGTIRGDDMCAIPLEPQRWVHYGHVTPRDQVLDEEARLFVVALRDVVARLSEHGGEDALVVSELPPHGDAVPQAGA